MKTNKEKNQLKNKSIHEKSKAFLCPKNQRFLWEKIKINKRATSALKKKSFVKIIKDKINENRALKTSVITFVFVLFGAILVIGGNVVVKDGQLNVTSDMFVDTSTLYVDSSNNRVGIGTRVFERNKKI